MTVLDRVPVAAITARAADIHFGRMLVSLLGGLLYLVGWLPAKLMRLLWLACAWSAAAVATGAAEAWHTVPDEADR